MIAIVDYGLGNIKAFYNIYKRLNIDCVYSSDSNTLKKATKIILPGVGSFDYAMEKLNNSGMRNTLDVMVLEKKTPVLGICVGMQIMAEQSEEGEGEGEGKGKGLGWISGSVKKLSDSNKKQYPLPHMGWNTIRKRKEHQIMESLNNEIRFYFLHSYHFDCDDRYWIASSKYSQEFSAIINKENIFGIQCHPEKSHHCGISFLKNFALI